MKHINEFSKQSTTYDENSTIQKRVSNHLLSKLTCKPKKILDLGCGTGYINKNIDLDYNMFVGVDSAKGMCEQHPTSSKIQILNDDFESVHLQDVLKKQAPFDLVISSSALQWAKDIKSIIKFTSSITDNIAFAIFTDKTFKDIYEITGLQTFLPKAQGIVSLCKEKFDIEYEIKTYKLFFEDNISKFRYIKRSGVSGGEKKLSLKQTKKLIEAYPHKYLEFEVLYITTKIK